MAHWAKPGVKCVCIRRDGFKDMAGECEPVFGGHYTIRTCHIGRFGLLYLRFEEIRNPVRFYGAVFTECSFNATGFRPLVTRTQEQDLQHFVPLLVNITSDEDA